MTDPLMMRAAGNRARYDVWFDASAPKGIRQTDLISRGGQQQFSGPSAFEQLDHLR